MRCRLVDYNKYLPAEYLSSLLLKLMCEMSGEIKQTFPLLQRDIVGIKERIIPRFPNRLVAFVVVLLEIGMS